MSLADTSTRVGEHWARLRSSGPPRFLPVATGVVVALVATEVVRQLAHPFLEHDDWDFLLPVERPRSTQMWDRLLAEGRWFNYGWWRTVGHLFSPFAAALVFTLAAVAFAAIVGRRWAPGWLAVPTVVALFASPMIADLSDWPATLAPSLLLVAAAAGILPSCLGRPRSLTLWIVLATVLVFLAYPPVTLMLLVVVVVEVVDRSVREVAVVVATFCAAYVGGTLLVFFLNLVAFGTFGIKVRPWRSPNPVHGVGDLFENVGRVGHQLGSLCGEATIPLALGAVAVAVCVALPRLRPRGLRLVALLVVGLGIQSAATVLTGVTTPQRSMGWIWLVVVIALVWVAGAVPRDRRIQVPAVLALIAVAGWGVHYWQGAIDHNQHRRAQSQRILERLHQLVQQTPGDRVYVFGTAADWERPKFTQEAQYLTEKAFHDYGVRITNCRPPACAQAQRSSVIDRADRGFLVVRTVNVILVIPREHH